jgi:hypothetical protein
MVILGDNFGTSVSVSGSVVVVGAPHYDNDAANQYGDRIWNSGAAYEFERQPDGRWAQVAKLEAADFHYNIYLGHSVAVSGDVAVIGAGSQTGNPDSAHPLAAYLYVRIALPSATCPA